MNKRLIGVLVLVLIIGGAVAYQATRGGGIAGPSVTLRGYIGSEKSNFLDNPDVQRVLRNGHGIEIDYRRAGSIEMIDLDHGGMDFLWPSSQVALELYQMTHGAAKSEIVFNSPIVFYSWEPVAAALVGEGYAEERGGITYLTDMSGLIEAVLSDTAWSDVGLDSLFGSMTITSTDPTRSNSGNMFAGLSANLLANTVVDDAALEEVLPDLLSLFRRQGLMEHSTGTLYERYLELGMGSYPLIVGYENQIVEFSLQNPELWEQVRGRMRILYPVPTVWSSHPVIALTDAGSELIAAMQDDEIQALAWEQHGFRTGLAGVVNDPGDLGISGIPQDITQIMRMPTPQVMDRIINELKEQ